MNLNNMKKLLGIATIVLLAGCVSHQDKPDEDKNTCDRICADCTKWGDNIQC